MLTNSELKQIKDYLALYGKKDSQLEAVNVDLDYPEVTFEANDYLSVVQDSKNKTIKIKDLEKVFLLTFLTDEDFREALKGKIPEEMLENACVTTEKLADGAVTTIKLGDNAVTTAKIATGAITGDKIANNTIQGSAFAANSITTDKIVDGTVTGDKLADGSIQSVDIKDNTLSGSKFVDGSISGSKIQDDVIESKHLLDNSIPASKIKDGSIESIDIKDGTLDGSKIKDNTIESAKLANNAITTDKIIDNSITTGKIANDAVTEDKIVDDSITTNKIANSSVTTDKIVDEAITGDKLADGAVTTAKLADGLISEIQNITDATPTTGSVKPVQSGGVKTAIDNVAFSTNEKVKNVGIDTEPTAGSDNLVKSGGVDNTIKFANIYRKVILNKTYNDSNGTIIDYDSRSITEKIIYENGAISNALSFAGAEVLFWHNSTYLGYSHNSISDIENWVASDHTLSITHIAFCWNTHAENIVYMSDALAVKRSVPYVNVSDYGCLPYKSSTLTTRFLNKALEGGNKTVVISVPGIYDLNDTILLYDNTELICCKGVILRKAQNYTNMFRNVGAETRTENFNISIKGLRISVNGKTAMHSLDSALYGLRGELAFINVSSLIIDDFRVNDLEEQNYGILVNEGKNVRISNFDIRGKKDAIHLSSTHSFIIENGVVQTVDDAIALNSCDWISSNCSNGSITDGIIENITDLHRQEQTGYTCRLLVGAWVVWTQGMEIKRGDTVVNNNRLYRAIIGTNTGESYYSQTEPTITTYSGTQQDSGGFEWKLMREGSYTRTEIRNVIFRNITTKASRAVFVEEVDTNGTWNRSLYPTVEISKYPQIKIDIENVRMIESSVTYDIIIPSKYTNSIITLRGLSGLHRELLVYEPINSALNVELNVYNNDFRDTNDVNVCRAGANTKVHFMDNIFGNVKRVVAGSVKSNQSIILAESLSPNAGDYIIDNGIPKIYNGTIWVSLLN